MSVSTTPFTEFVTTTTANVPQSLQSLLAALPAARKPSALSNPSGILRACYIQVQADAAGGATKYYWGNASTMTTTQQVGGVLQASQVWAPPSLGGNLYRLDQIFLMADASSANWYVTFICR